jgi:iron complex outermembrane receptor protein
MRIKANYRHTSGLVAVTLASSLAVPALAQDSTSETEFLDNAAQPRGVADIIVTAERRETSVQKSSLAISVVDGDALFRAGVSQARDLAALVPGLQIAAGGVTLQTYVRGIGDFSSSSLGQSAVAYNVDGIYVADTASISTLFYDVARVELLKGPQGTLYGRNSSAGAMNLVLNPPVLGEATGQGTFEVGNYDAVRATLTVNLPLGETVAVRASGNYVTRGGYLSDGTDDDGQRGGRLQLLFEPHAKLSVKIGGDIERRPGPGPRRGF